MSSPTEPAAAGRQQPPEGRVSRDASLAFLAQIVGAVLTAVVTIFLGRALAPAQYGYYTFALSVITLGSLFVDLGITTSGGRFLAERRGDLPAAAAVFRTTLRIKLWIGVPAAVCLFIFAEQL